MLSDGLTKTVASGTWSMTKDEPSWHAGFRRYAASKLCMVMMMYVKTDEMLPLSVFTDLESLCSSLKTPDLKHCLVIYNITVDRLANVCLETSSSVAWIWTPGWRKYQCLVSIRVQCRRAWCVAARG